MTILRADLLLLFFLWLSAWGDLSAQVSTSPVRIPAVPKFDCNGNGIPDRLDIRNGTSADCQGDGIPDECQLAVEAIYLHDDWLLDGSAGWGWPYYCWLTQHEVRAGHERITEVELAWGLLPPGSPVTVAIWSDPDGDLDPTDAQVLASVATTSSLELTGDLVRVDVPDTMIGPAGTSFFVGVYGAFDPANQPMVYDFGAPSGKSWIIMSSMPIQPDNLTAGVIQVGVLSDADWIVRAISCPSGHCGESSDDDFDGIVDDCQPQDCNGNGIPDDQDIALGVSMDCQGDGVPDECQLDPGTVVYVQDDGEMDTSVGTGHDYYAWLSQYVVQPGGEMVTDIEVAWGAMPPGTEVLVGLWSDPDGDGNPTDAQLLMGYPVLSTYEFTGRWVNVNIPDTAIGPAGTSFFVGASGFFDYDPTLPVWYAAGLDTNQPDLKAWFVSADSPLDLDDLATGAAEFGRLNTVCSCDGDWTIRAITCPGGHCGESSDVNQNGEPDECEPDCDGDGLPDDYEIATGLATDCDGNGLPDNCESLPDCDGNGLPDVCQAVTPEGLAGEYYASSHLAGEPRSRIDRQVVFDFGATPPFADEFPVTNFSVRWTGSLTTFGAGVYEFGVLYDDGVRLWVNGRLVIDRWGPSGAGVAFDTGTIELPAATECLVRLEYYQADGGSLVELHWQPPGGSMLPMLPSELRPIYDRNLDGIPDGCQLGADCNGNGVEDQDDLASGVSRDCDGDGIPDDCQHCEDSDGNGWPDSCELVAGPGLIGQYFRLDPNSLAFATRVDTRLDPEINFDWAGGAPIGLLADAFGVYWTGTLTTPAVSGSYTFKLPVDSGARLWLDGNLLIDGWRSPGTYSAAVNLAASTPYLLRLEYREMGGNAFVSLNWTVPGGASVTVPSAARRPDTDINGDGIPDMSLADCNLNGIPDSLDLDLNGNCVPDECEGGTGYWRFEEAGGSTAFDETPNNLDGTLSLYPYRVPDVPVANIPQTGAANLQSLHNAWIGSVRVFDAGGLLDVPNDDFTLEAWVKLDALGYNNGNPNSRQWLFMKKPQASSDAQLEYGFLAQAGNLGSSGRELAFRYGDGLDVYAVVSSLEIQDYGWHFVSVAYDAAWDELRFGIDGVFQTVPLNKPANSSAGVLLIGAHENQSGQENQWLFGTIDEPRFTRSFLPPEALLDHAP